MYCPADTILPIEKLVEKLSTQRASYYHTWYQVGQCLHNINKEFLHIWIKFSKRTTRNNFKEGECEKLWNEMKTPNYTLSTLCYFAMIDDRELNEDSV